MIAYNMKKAIKWGWPSRCGLAFLLLLLSSSPPLPFTHFSLYIALSLCPYSRVGGVDFP